MYKIAVLLTCFNRKQKTLDSLKHLYLSLEKVKDDISIDIYLTDDGSTDGTAVAVAENYPNINVLQGTGSLYWAGGMRNSWNEAIKTEYDAFLLLNDDTNVYDTMFTELIETHAYSQKKYGKGGIYCGPTMDKDSKEYTYGGHNFTNKFLAHFTKVLPNGKSPQSCELGNANIMWVSKNVVDEIGILSKKYIHGLADYDYTLMAVKKELPVLVTPNYLGNCSDDHTNPYKTFAKLSFKKRVTLLHSPVGLDFKSNLEYNRQHFPVRLPIVYLMGWAKVIFPTIYAKRHSNL
ncbi:GT2 family glycosyltransferase [Maribacter spongiicola]|uniref:GT2 family glycosyltransferase n=1 Tax=Maribacter spongiicola TaxID=1206753 RepID=A0A4R7K1N2_9FLAO|nr:glycosyltransferase [Maribacter spongiicola]TDT44751.1 GT2 family glycosyltransferase [Maribacter spongiicola]